jgi:hypothetical protein
LDATCRYGRFAATALPLREADAVAGRSVSHYYDQDAIATLVQQGAHRDAVGGLWDEIGRLQLEFMQRVGLAPSDRLLDIGCGCLRGGVHFVGFLEPGHYVGTDLSRPLLDAGYDELEAAGLAGRLPRENLVEDADFSFAGISGPFDFAIAFSLFTHLPFNKIRICLERAAPLLRPGGTLCATFFEIDDDHPTWLPAVHEPGGVTTRGDADPYHYRASDFQYAARSSSLDVRVHGDFGHYRGQRMLLFIRRR